MYTAEQYQRAKEVIGTFPPADQDKIRQRMAEYEASPKEGVAPRGGRGGGATAWQALGAKPVEPKLSHESPPIDSSLEAHGLQPLAPGEDNIDETLPNASKLKTLDTPPEYVATNWWRGLAHIAAATVPPGPTSVMQGVGHVVMAAPIAARTAATAPLANSYFEPGSKQFEHDQAALIKARGLVPGSQEYQDQFDEYKDKRWRQAYEQAKAEDRPLTRMEYVKNAPGWQMLKNVLATGQDMGMAFAEGFAAVPTLHGSRLATALSDAATGRSDVLEDQSRAERNPWSGMGGELAGAALPGGAIGKVAKAAMPARLAAGGLAARTLGAAVSGAVAAEADNAARSGAEAVGDVIHGGSAQTGYDHFKSHLLGSGLLGAGFGAGGHLLAEGAGAGRAALRRGSLGADLGQGEKGGMATDAFRGVVPPADVSANIEAARPPVPGEAKAQPEGTALELQMNKVQKPLAAENAATHKENILLAQKEDEHAYATMPELHRPKPATATANGLLDELLKKAKTSPDGQPAFLPLKKDYFAYAKPAAHIEGLKKFWTPKLVTAVEAPGVARAEGGRVISVKQAKDLDYEIDVPEPPKAAKVPANEPPHGLPDDAPPIDETSFDSAATAAHEVANSSGTLRDVQQFLNENRRPASAAERAGEQLSNTEGVDRFLAAARERGATYDGVTYRGMPPVQLEALLKDGETAHTWSVSNDPAGAESFAKKGGVFVTIEGGAGAVPVDGIEGSNTLGEAWIPKGQRFEVVSDEVQGGIRRVTVRAAQPSTTGPSTSDVFGIPAERPASAPRDLGPRQGRAFRTPATDPSVQDFFDAEGHATTVAKNGDRYGITDPFAAPRPGRSPSPDTPSRVDLGPSQAPVDSIRPSGPPAEMRAPARVKASPGAEQAQVAGVPADHYKVVMVPAELTARDFEHQVGIIDEAAKAGTEAQVDPVYKRLQAELRKDREQFGKPWADLKERQHERFSAQEQRASHANLKGNHEFGPDMPGDQQKAYTGGLLSYARPGNPQAADQALRSLAEDATKRSLAKGGPDLIRELNTLGTQRAYAALKEKAGVKVHESVGGGGGFARLGGLGSAIKLRTDAMARAAARGPTGESPYDLSNVSPQLLALVREGAPAARELLPGRAGLAGGALGMRAGVAYNHGLTPAQSEFLDKLIASVSSKQPEEPKAGASQ